MSCLLKPWSWYIESQLSDRTEIDNSKKDLGISTRPSFTACSVESDNCFLENAVPVENCGLIPVENCGLVPVENCGLVPVQVGDFIEDVEEESPGTSKEEENSYLSTTDSILVSLDFLTSNEHINSVVRYTRYAIETYCRQIDIKEELYQFNVELIRRERVETKRCEDFFELLLKYELKCKELIAEDQSDLQTKSQLDEVYLASYYQTRCERELEFDRRYFYSKVFRALRRLSGGKATYEDIERDLNRYFLNITLYALTAIFENSAPAGEFQGLEPNSGLWEIFVTKFIDCAFQVVSNFRQAVESLTIPKFLNTIQQPRQSSYSDVNRFKVGLYRLKLPEFIHSVPVACAA